MNIAALDLFGVTPWTWLLVPVLCFLLIRIADQAGNWHDAMVRIAGSTLIAAGCMMLLFLAVSAAPW